MACICLCVCAIINGIIALCANLVHFCLRVCTIENIFIIFNLSVLLVGIVLIAVGTIFYVSVDKYEEIIEEAGGLNIVPGMTIGIGVVVFVIAFLGFWGALGENSCMLNTYAGILVILLVVQFSIGIYGVVKVKDDDLEDEINKGIAKTFKRYKSDKVVEDIFQSVQSDLKCCGVDGPLDYFTKLEWPPGQVAGGCCGKPREKTCATISAYTEGCAKKLYDSINDAIEIVAYVALGICIVEFLGAVLATCLARSK